MSVDAPPALSQVAPSQAALIEAAFGEPAWRALHDAVVFARAGDPLAPVTVCAPSAAAGVAIRRRLARASGGVANVACTSLAELGDRLAAPLLAIEGRAPLDRVVAAEAVRAALAAEPHGSPFASVAANEATVAALSATLADLGDPAPEFLERLASMGTRQAAVARIHRQAHEVTGDRWAGEQARLELAAAGVDDGTATLGEIGAVILYLPRRLSRPEVRLLASLARRGVLTAIVGRTGDAAADAEAARLVELLAPHLGSAVAVGDPAAARPPTVDAVVRAPDPAEEARVAVRLVAEALTSGIPAERIAVAARLSGPYGLLLHEELTAAGIAHTAPGPGTLAQSMAGRVLLGALSLPDGKFRRTDVFAWLRSAPVRADADGTEAPAARWDRMAREAGVAGGPEQWQQRLARAREKRLEVLAWRAEHLEDQPDEDTKLADLNGLAAFVAALVTDTDPAGRHGWAPLADWARSLLARYLGDPDTVACSDADQRAHRQVLDVLASLASLGVASLGPPPDVATFRHVLAEALDRPAPRVGTMGRGVLVGQPAELVGGDLDLVVVVGMAEGIYPPRPGDDPLLPDRERALLGVERRGTERAAEHRDHLAALAAARHRVVSFARADTRSQRERQPARWLLDACAARWGRASVYADDLAPLRAERPAWFIDVESFEWWAAEGRPPATPHDFDVATLVTARRSGVGLDRTAVVTAEPVLARGLEAVVARQRGQFGPWNGSVGHRPGFLADLEHPQSATGLETWATCPFRYLLGKVLGVAEIDDPAEADEITAVDRGSLVHEVLERFVGARLQRPAGEPWSAEDHTALADIADEITARYESEGRTGRSRLWRLRWAQLRQHLDRLLTADDELRRTFGVQPHAVELGFGFPEDATPPVVVDAGGGRRVAFRGRIDRVDLSPDGRRALVLDYKTAAAKSYPSLRGAPDAVDLTGAGRHLQLLVYADAARAATGAEEVDARFWFVRPGEKPEALGGPVDDRATQRFHQVLTTVVDGVEHGRFPARPGEETFFGFANCGWCAYDRVCGKGRGERWEGLRAAPELRDYLALVEPADPQEGEP